MTRHFLVRYDNSDEHHSSREISSVGDPAHWVPAPGFLRPWQDTRSVSSLANLLSGKFHGVLAHGSCLI
jgi:hypothetical protein